VLPLGEVVLVAVVLGDSTTGLAVVVDGGWANGALGAGTVVAIDGGTVFGTAGLAFGEMDVVWDGDWGVVDAGAAVVGAFAAGAAVVDGGNLIRGAAVVVPFGDLVAAAVVLGALPAEGLVPAGGEGGFDALAAAGVKALGDGAFVTTGCLDFGTTIEGSRSDGFIVSLLSSLPSLGAVVGNATKTGLLVDDDDGALVVGVNGRGTGAAVLVVAVGNGVVMVGAAVVPTFVIGAAVLLAAVGNGVVTDGAAVVAATCGTGAVVLRVAVGNGVVTLGAAVVATVATLGAAAGIPVVGPIGAVGTKAIGGCGIEVGARAFSELEVVLSGELALVAAGGLDKALDSVAGELSVGFVSRVGRVSDVGARLSGGFVAMTLASTELVGTAFESGGGDTGAADDSAGLVPWAAVLDPLTVTASLTTLTT
jgi:hypothetical protein